MVLAFKAASSHQKYNLDSHLGDGCRLFVAEANFALNQLWIDGLI